MPTVITSELAQLEVIEGLRIQEVNDEVPYTFTTTKWMSGPTSATVVATDEADDSTVTTTVFPTNSPTPTGDVIALSLMKDLTANHTYRVKICFTDGTTILNGFFRVLGVEI